LTWQKVFKKEYAEKLRNNLKKNPGKDIGWTSKLLQ
jgi:hypothetical protein